MISSIVFLYVKNLSVCVCVCVCVCVLVVVGGQGVITIQTSTMTPLSATVSSVSTARGVGRWGSGYKCILLSQRVLVYACAKSTDVK